MITEEEKQNIFDDLNKRHTTIHELLFLDVEKIFRKHNFSYKGNRVIANVQYPNIVFWAGWNNEAVELLFEYQKKYNLTYVPVNILVYLTSGGGLNLPLYHGKRNPKLLKNEHWIPVNIVTRKEWERFPAK